MNRSLKKLHRSTYNALSTELASMKLPSDQVVVAIAVCIFVMRWCWKATRPKYQVGHLDHSLSAFLPAATA
jgi:hypothetical protein